MHRQSVRLLAPWLTYSLFLVAGCGTAVPDYDDPNSIPVDGDTSGINPKADTDGDGYFDVDEGAADSNMNGTPAHLDPTEQSLGGVSDPARDTDADGTPDLTEGVGDANMNGVPAYRDPDEGGTTVTDGGTDGSMEGGAGQVPFGQPCTAADTCASAGGATGCCESASMECGALAGGACQTGVVCGGSFCAGSNACCSSSGQCSTLAADGVTCGSGGSDAGTDSGSGDDSGTAPGPCPNGGCCSSNGLCGEELPFLGCIETGDIACTP